MECPACRKVLIRRKYHRLTIDICPSCEGFWFDPGELGEFIEDILCEFDASIPPIELDKPILALRTINEEVRLCPRCRKPMNKTNYGCDSNVIIDRCPGCEGVWTDGGEIQRIASHVKGHPKLHAMGHAIITSRKETEENIQKARNLLYYLLYLVRGLW